MYRPNDSKRPERKSKRFSRANERDSNETDSATTKSNRSRNSARGMENRNRNMGVGNAHGSVAGGPGVRSVVHSEGMIATTSRTSSRPVYCV